MTRSAGGRRVWLGALVALFLAGVATAEEKGTVARLVFDGAAPPDPNRVLRIVRDGKAVAFDSGYVKACDWVELRDASQRVTVQLSTHTVRLHEQPKPYRLPCDGAFGWAKAAFAKVLAIREAADARSFRRQVSATTRGGPALEIPMLSAPDARLVAGPQRVYLRWQGGEGPFTVILQRVNPGAAGARELGEVVARVDGVSAREAHLPQVTLQPGRYRLELRPARGDALAEENLEVLPPSAVPALPPEVAGAAMPAALRAVLHANYLLTLDEGRWTLLAAQQVAAHAGNDAAARHWLEEHGGSLTLPR